MLKSVRNQIALANYVLLVPEAIATDLISLDCKETYIQEVESWEGVSFQDNFSKDFISFHYSISIYKGFWFEGKLSNDHSIVSLLFLLIFVNWAYQV